MTCVAYALESIGICVLRIPGAWPGQIQKTTSINGFLFFRTSELVDL